MNEITVFISYSHDSDVHREKVLGLSERLRADGIATILDRYLEKGVPAEGWPRWMMNSLNASTFVFCICTETYCRRFLGLEGSSKGKGADWEGALITQALYEARIRINKFIPVLFDNHNVPNIPEPLRGQTHYILESESSYTALYDCLLSQAGIEPGILGELKRKARDRGNPTVFGEKEIVFASYASAHRTVAETWREKLEFLLIEDAVCVDPAMKFRLKHLISEARQTLRSLGCDNL